eukprot:COSAG02_NODE_2555_length_8532_cov_7.259900_7_plen_243_part_00
MIPLMLQKDYRPQGWRKSSQYTIHLYNVWPIAMSLIWEHFVLAVVGLIMGTRLWYQMWDAEKDDDEAFERRMDSVMREVGDRGKLLVAEAMTPFREPNLVPAPAPASAPISLKHPTISPRSTPAPVLAATPGPLPAPAVASAATPATSSTFTPNGASRTPPPTTLVQQHATGHGDHDPQLITVAFMREERDHLEQRMESIRTEAMESRMQVEALKYALRTEHQRQLDKGHKALCPLSKTLKP